MASRRGSEKRALIADQPSINQYGARGESIELPHAASGGGGGGNNGKRVSARGFGEDSPSYAVLAELLVSDHRLHGAADLNLIAATSTRCYNMLFCCLHCCGTKTFEVSNGSIRLGTDGSGGFLVYGAGVHLVMNLFLQVQSRDTPLSKEVIQWGDRTICTVKQGHVGYCEDRGQPVLLPPGLHEWRSPTLKFVRSVDLNNTLIKLGPYTVLTVDEGYAAITQNNGRQVIMEGGQTHLLSHRNWKFEKFMTEKIQTDDLPRIEATSADNVKMHTLATVVWRITDVENAARMSAATMRDDGADTMSTAQSDISKLRNDVLKQATASLAAFIGEVRYSDTFHLSAMGASDSGGAPDVLATADKLPEYSPIWDTKRMASAVEGANLVTATYGVTVISVNIISAVPADNALQMALAKGAVASAEAEQAETIARGQARAARIMAEGDAQAETIRAEGSKTAADTLASSAVAVELAKIDRVAAALSEKTSFFFGADPKAMGSLLSNPAMVQPGV